MRDEHPQRYGRTRNSGPDGTRGVRRAGRISRRRYVVPEGLEDDLAAGAAVAQRLDGLGQDLGGLDSRLCGG